uniref:Glycosyl transferase n=1 Tax=Eubacterium cellulosolvens (strain ATCC 43171 / JCM 9499 / 6) TaxID=633697 RepID=I5AQ97_EUBC6
MNDRIFFSVIIPVYNAEKYLTRCVKSVCNQNYANVEVVLVDDGSSDNSSELCDVLAQSDNRIKVIHKRNQGVSIARKDGVQISRSDYVIFVDSDDYISQGLLRASEKIIEKHNPDIILFEAVEETHKKKHFERKYPYRDGFYTKEDIHRDILPTLIQADNASYFPPAMWGKVIKRELLLSNLLANTKASIAEDGASIIPCMFHAKSFYYLKESYYNYTYNADSATKKHKALNWDWYRIVNIHISERINLGEGDLELQLARKIVHDFFNTAFTQFYENEYRRANNEIMKQMEMDPIKTALGRVKFDRTIKAKLMVFALKRHIFFLLYLYSKIR